MPYLNVDEVETALTVASGAPNAAFTQLITLPHNTWDGRQCHAIRIANGSGPERIGVYLLGGVHAREWGSPDILVNFVEKLCDDLSDRHRSDVRRHELHARPVQSLVNRLDVVVFPRQSGRSRVQHVDRCWVAKEPPAGARVQSGVPRRRREPQL